jgi:hypothetical protein
MSKVVKFMTANLLAFGSLFLATPSQAAVLMTTVTCDNGTHSVGWDNNHEYFADKGNIAAHFCELVHQTGYVSDTLTDPAHRYFGGIIPENSVVPVQPTPETISEDVVRQEPASEEVLRPEPTPEPSPQSSPEPVPTPQPVIPPAPEPAAPAPEPAPPIEEPVVPIPEATPDAPAPAPTPTQEPEPTPEPVVVPTPTPEPPTPAIEPPTVAEQMNVLAAAAVADDPQVSEELAAIPLLGNAAVAVLEAFNALGNVGADMLPEERKEAQQVVVSSVIVGQIATTASLAMSGASYRRIK